MTQTNKTMKIKHNDQEYELNVEKAIRDGYLILEHKIEAGNVYRNGSTTIVLVDNLEGKFKLIGNNFLTDGGFHEYSDPPRTANEFRTHFLTGYGGYGGDWKFVGKAKITW